MTTYHEQKVAIDALNLKHGQVWRGACIFCQGNNTLSATNIHGTLLWHCFRASCTASGCSKGTLSKYDITQIIHNKEHEDRYSIWEIPEWFQYIADTGSSSEMMQWLANHQLWNMSKRKLIELRFDPKLQRVVLIKTSGNNVVNAIGYSIDKAIHPKWYKYTVSRAPFIIDPGSSTAVIVEDVPSAAVVAAAGLTGIALMGTTYLDSFTTYITKYKRAIIALDKDATQKSLTMQKNLSFFMPCMIKRLDTDLKYWKPERLVEYLSVQRIFNITNI